MLAMDRSVQVKSRVCAEGVCGAEVLSFLGDVPASVLSGPEHPMASRDTMDTTAIEDASTVEGRSRSESSSMR